MSEIDPNLRLWNVMRGAGDEGVRRGRESRGGGRERTEDEWRALFEAGGLQVEQIEDGLIQARCR